MFNWDSTVVAEEYKLLKGAQRSAVNEESDGVRAGSGVEGDEEDSDAYEDEEGDEWVVGLPDPENQTVADLLLDVRPFLAFCSTELTFLLPRTPRRSSGACITPCVPMLAGALPLASPLQTPKFAFGISTAPSSSRAILFISTR